MRYGRENYYIIHYNLLDIVALLSISVAGVMKAPTEYINPTSRAVYFNPESHNDCFSIFIFSSYLSPLVRSSSTNPPNVTTSLFLMQKLNHKLLPITLLDAMECPSPLFSSPHRFRGTDITTKVYNNF